MIKKSIIKRRPMSGLGKSKRKRTGCIFFDKQWIGMEVVTIDYKNFVSMNMKIKILNTKINDIQKIINRNSKYLNIKNNT